MSQVTVVELIRRVEASRRNIFCLHKTEFLRNRAFKKYMKAHESLKSRMRREGVLAVFWDSTVYANYCQKHDNAPAIYATACPLASDIDRANMEGYRWYRWPGRQREES